MNARPFFGFSLLLLCCLPAAADVRPPARIRLDPGPQPAISQQPFSGVFRVEVGGPGALSDFELRGEGWTVLEAQFPAAGARVGPGPLLIPFKAMPTDADRPLQLRLKYDGRRVKRSFEVGPAARARLEQRGRVRVLKPGGVKGVVDPTPVDGAGPRGGAIPLRFTGRLVYQRPDGHFVGADHIRVWVYDDDGLADDPIPDETVWAGETDERGFFDSGVIFWDDCDIVGCDDPDLYVHFECDTGIAQVQTTDIDEVDYFWRTMDNIIEDFTGTEVDFGTIAPADAGQFGAIHIWNSIIRAHRFVLDRSGINLPIVDVQWPESENGAYYVDFFEEIHVGPDRTWEEGTHTHEYGHHFLENRSDSPSPDYCNGFCDGDVTGCDFDEDCEEEGHCLGCQETDHDAFNEGWPDWLGDVIPRNYPNLYVFDDLSPYTPFDPDNFENPTPCCVDGQFHDPVLTEGFVAALLRDIEDPDQDDHNGDGIMDLLCLGPEEIIAVVDSAEPTTVLQFLDAFRNQFPQHSADLWSTAFNAGGPAYAGPVNDTQPPGVVTFCDSPSHPIGVGGPMPCIDLEFTAASDVGSGASRYSFRVAPTAAGLPPDSLPETLHAASECHIGGKVAVSDLGLYWVSIRAGDNAGNWSSSYATFGPFEVTDCNGSGALDVCDIRCCEAGCDAGPPGECSLSGLVCPPDTCRTSTDCNGNFQPDECDIAQGLSLDCDQDGVPDECETNWLKHWNGGGDDVHPTWFHSPSNWEEHAVPELGDDVCIAADEITPLLRQTNPTLGNFACYGDFDLQPGAGLGGVTLTLNKASFIDGDLNMTQQNPILYVNDTLTIGGVFNWSAGHLRGLGETSVTGSLMLGGSPGMFQHTLNLQCDTVSSGGFQPEFSVIRNFPGRTFNHLGVSVNVAAGNGSLFDNQGLFVKSGGTGHSQFGCNVNNSGVMRVDSGELRILYPLQCSGAIVGAPGTILTLSGNGPRELEATSSLTGDQLNFSGSLDTNIRGAYDADSGTSITGGGTVWFRPGANVVDYGDDVLVAANGHFLTTTGHPMVMQTLIVTGMADFANGDPIVTQSLTLTAASIRGVNKNITVNGPFAWNNGGSIFDSGVIHANGGLTIGPGGTQKNLQSDLRNAGVATINGAFLTLEGGAVHNLATGVWDIQADGTLIAGSPLLFDNAGVLRKSAGAGTSTLGSGNPSLRPTFLNSGVVEVQIGTLAFSWGSFTQSAGEIILDGGNLTMAGSPAMPLQLNGGRLRGAGTVTAVVNNAGAVVAPGASAGALAITGAYNQGAGGTLEMEIGGAGAGEFDHLTVSGAATLDGTLRVTKINGYQPSSGATFVIVSAGSRSGEFSAINVPGFDVSYTATEVIMTANGALPGDLDGDCDVDLGDMATILSNYGMTGASYADGDLDGDGTVGIGDVAALIANYGLGC